MTLLPLNEALESHEKGVLYHEEAFNPLKEGLFTNMMVSLKFGSLICKAHFSNIIMRVSVSSNSIMGPPMTSQMSQDAEEKTISGTLDNSFFRRGGCN